VSDLLNKSEMTEEDIKLKYITPAIECKWDKHSQIRMEYNFTDGRIIVRGNAKPVRGKRKKADYILYYKRNLPLAIVEAKDNKHSLGAGMQQGLEYAAILDIPFVYSSNGDGFLEHDMTKGSEREISLDEFPSPDELWNRHKSNEAITPEQENLITEPYYFRHGDKSPRYYQQIAINRTIEAIAKGQNRIHSSWRPVRARLARRFKSSIVYGSQDKDARYFTLQTVTFSSIRPCNRTSSRSRKL
jgi:type I restriction enzyme R subunit